MTMLTWPVLIPLVAGILAFFLPRVLARWFAVIVTAFVFAACIAVYAGGNASWSACGETLLSVDPLGRLILLGVGFFAFLMTLYSAGFGKTGTVSEGYYYANILLSVGAGCGVALSANFVLLGIFWGLLSIPLYLLINAGAKDSESAAKKTMLILGGTDSVLLLGIAAFFVSTGGFGMFPEARVVVAGGAAWFGVLCITAAALAKAGAMPFHTWVPDACQTAPVPVAALLPASLDKLLGIYLLARVFLTLYEIPAGLKIACMLLGAATIVFAVMSAMVQHNLRRLLGFHAVSQVGYMVVGVATGNPIGVLGGLFHMLNNAIYKSCLFLTAGAAERKTGETELDRMGGLAKAMPLSFVAAVVAAFAISGVPPLNGFASKWMIYNGIIAAKGLGPVWIVVLVAAMFGSALTLASFVKVLHSVFLGQPKKPVEQGPNPSFLMKAPMALLALLCVVLGVFALRAGVDGLILPSVRETALFKGADMGALHDSLNVWSSGVATVLLVAALILGGLIYLFSTFTRARESDPFVCGETGKAAEEFNFEGVEFYKTVSGLPVLNGLYRQAEAKWYDLYEELRRLTFYVSGWLRKLHDGSLHNYVTWCVLGLVVILWWLLYTFRILGRAF